MIKFLEFFFCLLTQKYCIGKTIKIGSEKVIITEIVNEKEMIVVEKSCAFVSGIFSYFTQYVVYKKDCRFKYQSCLYYYLVRYHKRPGKNITWYDILYGKMGLG